MSDDTDVTTRPNDLDDHSPNGTEDVAGREDLTTLTLPTARDGCRARRG